MEDQQKKLMIAKRQSSNAYNETDGLYERKRREVRQKGGDQAIYTDRDFPANQDSLAVNWQSQDFKRDANVNLWR